MRQFKYFVCGLVSAIAFIPVIDKTQEVINIWLESKKSKSLEKVLDTQKKVAMMSEFTEPQSEVEYYVEYMDDDFE